MSINKYASLKFGESALNSPASFEKIQNEILHYRNDGFKVVAAVSAYFGVTERLIEKADAMQGIDRLRI